MKRRKTIETERTTNRALRISEEIDGKMGITPKLLRALGKCPSAIKAYLEFIEGGDDHAQCRPSEGIHMAFHKVREAAKN